MSRRGGARRVERSLPASSRLRGWAALGAAKKAESRPTTRESRVRSCAGYDSIVSPGRSAPHLGLSFICLAAILAMTCPAGLLKAQVIQGSWEQLEAVRPGTKLAVTRMDHGRARGRFAQVSPDSLTVRHRGLEVTIRKGNVLKVDRVSRLRGLLWGAAIGAGTGFVAGAIADIGPNEGGEGALGRLIFTSYGLIAGPIAGVLHQKRRTLYRTTSLEEQSVFAATQSAESWLARLDRKEFSQAWDEASELLRASADERSWVATLTGVRSRNGKLLQRKRKAAAFHDALPNLPDGACVTIRFVSVYEATYEPRRSIKESMTLVRTEAGWRVARHSQVTLR